MAKNLRMVLCYQNRVSKGTNQHYGLYSRASIFVHSASITEQRRFSTNYILTVFRLATCT